MSKRKHSNKLEENDEYLPEFDDFYNAYAGLLLEKADQFERTCEAAGSLSILDNLYAVDLIGLKHDEDGVLIKPDTYTFDCLFTKYFLSNELRQDLGAIASDFLKRQDLKEYASPRYIMPEATPGFEDVTLSLMICAIRKGNNYARRLLIAIYQKYFKKEYNQLKRFKHLSFMELPDIEMHGDQFPEMIRTLFMAEMMEIEIDTSCYTVYQIVEEVWNQFQDDPKLRLGEIPQGLLDKESEELDRQRDDIVAEYEGYEGLFDTISFEYFHPLGLLDEAEWDVTFDTRMERALLFTGDAYLGDYKATPAEVAAAMVIDSYHRSLEIFKQRQTLQFEHYMGIRTSDDDRINSVLRSIPDSAKETPTQTPAQPSASKDTPTPKEDTEESSKAALEAEVAKLRLKLHEQEGTIQDIRISQKTLSDRVAEIASLKASREKDRVELEALRKYVQSIEEPNEEKEISLEEMKKTLRDKKIAIVGGNQNWVKKMAQEFHGWRFISASVSPTTTATSIQSMDHVVFFTDTLGHSSYYKFMQITRNSGVPFSYLHGVNIEENIKRVKCQVKM